MAELDTASSRRRPRGVRKTKKLSTRVDLTPMVDLGFLLITFFIYSTTMTRPTTMRLVLPADGNPTTTRASSVITLVLGPNNRIYYYEGMNPASGKTTDFAGIRSIICDKKHRSNPDWFQVILKPSADCTYGNTVSILDEMKIDQVRHYVLTDISMYETELLRSHRAFD